MPSPDDELDKRSEQGKLEHEEADYWLPCYLARQGLCPPLFKLTAESGKPDLFPHESQ